MPEYAYNRKLGTDGRLTLPRPLRAEFGLTGVLTRWMPKCLAILRPHDFTRLCDGLSYHRSVPDSQGHLIARFLSGSACEVEFDRRGRFLLPGALREYADLGTDITVVGICAHVEIWSTDLLRQRLEMGSDCPSPEALTGLLRMG